MSTLAEIRNQTRVFISQTDSSNTDVSDSVLNGYINQAIRYFSVYLRWPRKVADVTVVAGTSTYTLPSDCISLMGINFGNPSISGDMQPLQPLEIEQLEQAWPGWQETANNSRGIPFYYCVLNETQYLITPTPNDLSAVSGKLFKLRYQYYPADLSSDLESPVLPIVYHDAIAIYVAHLAYMGPLKNIDSAAKLLTLLKDRFKEIRTIAENQNDNRGWTFSSDDFASFSEDNWPEIMTVV